MSLASQTAGTIYPNNMLADALGIPVNEIPYKDVDETASELLEILPREYMDIMLRRYRNQEGLAAIAKDYTGFASTVRHKINTALKKMRNYRNGWILKYGCEYVDTHPMVTLDTRIIDLDMPKEMMDRIEFAYMSVYERINSIDGHELEASTYEEIKEYVRISDIIRLIRMKEFSEWDVDGIVKQLELFGLTVTDIYGDDYEELQEWAEYSDEVKAGDWEFPFNLINAVFGIKNDRDLDGLRNGMSQWEALSSVYHVLGMLDEINPRWPKILLMRFRDKMTLQQVGDVLHLTRDRIRQIEVHAMRKLRHPSRAKYLKTGGYNGYMERLWEDEDRRVKEREAILQGKIDRLTKELKNEKGLSDFDVEKIAEDREGIDYEKVMNIVLEDLDLSVRAYNVLKRADCNTVRDILYAFKSDQIMKFRNMGRKSMEEVAAKLITLGFSAEDLEVDDTVVVDYQQKKEEKHEAEMAKRRKEREDREQKELDEAIKKSKEVAGKCFTKAITMMSAALRSLGPNEKVIGIVLRTTEERDSIAYSYGDPFRAYIRDVAPSRHMVELEASVLNSLNGIYRENYSIRLKSDGYVELPFIRVDGFPIDFNAIKVERIGFPEGLLNKLKEKGYDTSGEIVNGLRSNKMDGFTAQERRVLIEFLIDMGYPVEAKQPQGGVSDEHVQPSETDVVKP